MASFQGFFPAIIDRICALETELSEMRTEESQEEGEKRFYRRLNEFKERVETATTMLNQRIMDVDDDIVFFGNHENDLPGPFRPVNCSSLTARKRMRLPRTSRACGCASSTPACFQPTSPRSARSVMKTVTPSLYNSSVSFRT